jgi:hypothetical protein
LGWMDCSVRLKFLELTKKFLNFFFYFPFFLESVYDIIFCIIPTNHIPPTLLPYLSSLF